MTERVQAYRACQEWYGQDREPQEICVCGHFAAIHSFDVCARCEGFLPQQDESDLGNGGVDLPHYQQTVKREYTIRHPIGHVEEVNTATSFGPQDDLAHLQRRLEIADSDCLCSESGSHSIVVRTITVGPWQPFGSDQGGAS